MAGSINSHSPEFFGTYSIEWLIVLPLSGMTNFYSSANLTNSESSDTSFFSAGGKGTNLAQQVNVMEIAMIKHMLRIFMNLNN